MGVTHPSMDKASSFLSTYDVELRGRGAWGRFFFVACPADFSSFCDSFFFLNQNKRGGAGVGPGSSELQTLSWGGGVGGAFFFAFLGKKYDEFINQ